MRLFVAVNFTGQVRDAVADAIERLRLYNPPWRWAHRDNWHVTVKFLGETLPRDVEPITRCLQDISARHTTFAMSLSGLGGFPDLSRPRVLFFSVEQGKEELTRLAADVENGLFEAAGIPRENRPFRAHATVARIKKRLPQAVTDKLKRGEPLSGVSQVVTAFDLMQSELGPDGARYTLVKQFALPQAS